MAEFKSYIEKSEQYQKHYQKQHQKPKRPHEQHHEQTLGNDYSKKVEESPLIAEEIDDLFWGKLVKLGWRFNSKPLLNDKTSTAEIKQFIFVCSDCDKPLHIQNVNTLLPSQVKNMCDISLLSQKLFQHKREIKDCNPVEE